MWHLLSNLQCFAKRLLLGLLRRRELSNNLYSDSTEFRSVLSTLPHPGHLLRIENTIDMDGNACRAYVWQHLDPQMGERISLFCVQDGRYIEDMLD